MLLTPESHGKNAKKKITCWSEHCNANCLQLPSVQVASISIKSPEPRDTIIILQEYQEYKEVFSKTKASGMPPHCPYDCAIGLLAGAVPESNRIYPCLPRKHRLWRNTLRRPSNGVHPPLHITCLCWVLLCGEKMGED